VIYTDSMVIKRDLTHPSEASAAAHDATYRTQHPGLATTVHH
jgi:hypothetical protein